MRRTHQPVPKHSLTSRDPIFGPHRFETVDDYPDLSDLPAVDGTSNLSADLKFGTLAACTVADVVGIETPGRQAFVRQIA
jgi:deoxyribodipyrimidine photo-lyase